MYIFSKDIWTFRKEFYSPYKRGSALETNEKLEYIGKNKPWIYFENKFPNISLMPLNAITVTPALWSAITPKKLKCKCDLIWYPFTVIMND